MNNFDAHTQKDRQDMLNAIGLSSVDDLYQNLPEEIKTKNLDLPEPLSELFAARKIKKFSVQNNIDYACFMGGGASKHFIPEAVNQITSRFEFNTAYTPYQAEISQGTLQSIYEYQTMICNLTNMDVSNASMYDTATACSEAILMAARVTGRKKCLISDKMYSDYIEVIKTYCEAADIEISYDFTTLNNKSSEYACVLIQTPDGYGEILDIDAFRARISDDKTLLVCCVDSLSLAIVEPPQCDVMVGNLQPLGNPVLFGGPYGAFFACKDKYKRQMPGRVIGRTIDKDGNQAFCLTLQTREQHIRRDKATSNICSNQALVALQSTVYLSLMGPKGLVQAAKLSASNAHKLADKLKAKGFEIETKNFINEFVLKVANADNFLQNLKANKILGGTKIDDRRVLVCATELNTDDEINMYEYFAV